MELYFWSSCVEWGDTLFDVPEMRLALICCVISPDFSLPGFTADINTMSVLFLWGQGPAPSVLLWLSVSCLMLSARMKKQWFRSVLHREITITCFVKLKGERKSLNNTINERRCCWKTLSCWSVLQFVSYLDVKS